MYEKAERGTSEGEPDAKMFCEICRNNKVTAYKLCSMFSGTNAFRKDTLSFHWKNQAHIKCAERQAVKLKSKETQGSNLVGPIVEWTAILRSKLKSVSTLLTLYEKRKCPLHPNQPLLYCKKRMALMLRDFIDQTMLAEGSPTNFTQNYLPIYI